MSRHYQEILAELHSEAHANGYFGCKTNLEQSYPSNEPRRLELDGKPINKYDCISVLFAEIGRLENLIQSIQEHADEKTK